MIAVFFHNISLAQLLPETGRKEKTTGMPSPNRPQRLQIVNELGALQTLPEGPGSFTALGKPAGRVLLLGPGPDPAVPAALLEGRGALGSGVS
jgi:hypothetical protein